jgi:excinuclease ABC subunit B
MIQDDEKIKVEGAVDLAALSKDDINKMIRELEKEMKAAAQSLEFEKAAVLRDQISELRGTLVDKQVEESLLVN